MRIRELARAGVFLIFCPCSVAAQTIQGRVLETGTRLPVVGAEVVLLDPDERVQTRALTTDEGAFLLRVAEAGWHTLRVSHLGYAAFRSDSIHAGPAETVSLEIRLGQTAIPLEPLVVTARSQSNLAEFHERRASNAFGRFITQEEIERRASGETTDLLRGLAGVGIMPVRVRGRTINRITMQSAAAGPCEPALFMDGVHLIGPNVPVDEILTPHVIAGVEVYSSSAGAPARYSDVRGCGSVVFWTRTGENDPTRRFSWRRTVIGLCAAAIAFTLLLR